MPTLHRRATVFAVAAGFSAVALGAFGAHALRPLLEVHGHVATWETAIHYHLLHSVVLLTLALYLHRGTAPDTARRLDRAGGLLTSGITLFSGSLYLFALGGPQWIVHLTPVGGVCLLVGWLAIGHALWQRDN